jgi:hypothetical protein
VSHDEVDKDAKQTAFTSEAEHIPVRAFRKRLASIVHARRVVVVGGHAAPTGIFIPLSVDRWSGQKQILAAALRALRKIKSIERYRAESE